jgi:hypothetical protein
VERTFAWMTRCRSFGKDDETLPERSEAMISLAMTRFMIRRLAQGSPFPASSWLLQANNCSPR